MTFLELDDIISRCRRRSIASALVACLVDALDRGEDGLDLDAFQAQRQFVRNNVTSVAAYLQECGVLEISFYKEADENTGRVFVKNNVYGRWAKQHYHLSTSLKSLYQRN